MNKLRGLFALFCLLSLNVFAQNIANIIPSSNLPPTGNWQGIAGVPGGIDQYSTNYAMFCNVRVSIPGTSMIAYGDGIHDDTAAINFAVSACPNNQYVYIPTGNYLLTGPISRGGVYNYDGNTHPFSIIIRGDGPGNTVLLDNASGGEIILFQNNSGFVDYNAILAGNVRGSTNLSLSAIPANFSGVWLMIERNDSQQNVYRPPAGDPNPFYYTYGQCADQLVKVTGSSGTNTYIWPPLNETSPDTLITVPASPPFRCGIENLTVVRLQDVNSHNLRIIDGMECWIRNVESRQARGYHISLEQCGGCEVRECYVHDPFPYKDGSTAGGGSDYGITLGFHSSSCLVEDNIALHCRHSFILETGAGQDNVIDYNYGKDNINEGMFETDYQEDTDYHGGEPRFNLYEGNTLPIIRADAVEGGTKYDTYFRNYVTRDGIQNVSVAMFAQDIQRGNYYDYFLDNVYATCSASPSTQVYRIGSWEDAQTYPGQSYAYDTNVILNDVWLGNLDLSSGKVDQSANGVISWVGSISDSFPSSLIYASKPSWYGLATWPPFGSDVGGYTNMIPAQLRAATITGFAASVSDSYTLTLNAANGTASAPGNLTYYNGAMIAISATPNSGQAFLNWTGFPVANSASAMTYFTMPAANSSIAANFGIAANYNLTVNNGTGGGSFVQGTIAVITAAIPPAGQQFAYWSVSSPVIGNTNLQTATLIMPAANVAAAAVFRTVAYYTLTVNNGYSDGGSSFPAGTVVTIHAGTPPTGQSFYNWNGYSALNAFSANTTLVMPASNVAITANFNIASGSQPDRTVIDGLVAWWKFDEGSGTNIVDSSGNGNNGYLVGSPKPAWVSGKYGNALQFDGSQSYAVGGTINEPVNSNFSVSYWANYPSNPSGTIVSTWQNSNFQNNWYLNCNSATVNGIVGGPYGSPGICNILLGTVPTSGWHNYVLTVDFQNKLAQYFIDGVLISTNLSYSSNNPAPVAPNPLSIGSLYASSPNSVFNGGLDDLRIYNRVLTAGEIQKIYLGKPSTGLAPPVMLPAK